MSKSYTLRDAAKGKPCLVWIPGCPQDHETTVLCHLRMDGNAGIAEKPDDLVAVLGCDYCHSVIDGRRHAVATFDRAQVLLSALSRTLTFWSDNGTFTVVNGALRWIPTPWSAKLVRNKPPRRSE